MNTLLALTLIASAYGFIVTILLLNQKARAKEYSNRYFNLEHKMSDTMRYSRQVENDRDQLAQALKETQAKLDSIKVRRDPKTGRMVSAKRK